MDSARFDNLLRSLALGLSRRTTLGAALGALVAPGGSVLLADNAGAKKKHKRKRSRSSTPSVV